MDEDIESLKSLRTILLQEKFEIFEAASGEEALEFLENQEVEIIISDSKMKGAEGINFASEVREWDTNVPVIFVSSGGEEKDWIDGIHTHASAFVQKPFSKQTILKAVHKAIKENTGNSI